MLGYDWARLHAAVNDLPAALLLCSVLFDLLGWVNRRDGLKAAGFWCLVVGTLGAGAAVLTGELAEGRVDHTDAAHAVMETHETLALVTLGVFGVLLGWRLLRRGLWTGRELPTASIAGMAGVAILIYTARLGGSIVFDHGLGISTERLHGIVDERGAHDHDGHSDEEGDEDHEREAAMPDSAGAGSFTSDSGGSSGLDHTHTDGTQHLH